MSESQIRDIDLMKNSKLWPYDTVLPLWQVGSQAVGFLYAHNQPIVYFGNIMNANLFGKPLTELPQRRYGDFGAIVRDGWRVGV